jgi:hypothetical protein
MHEDLRKLIEFIKIVSNKPGMFLVNNIEDLSLTVFGYRFACAHHASNLESIDEFLDSFKLFINVHYKTGENLDWARLIRFHCVNDFTTLQFFDKKFNEFVSEYCDRFQNLI